MKAVSHSKAIANAKVFANKLKDTLTDRRTDGQTGGPRTTCRRSIDVGA